jgi:hypothetical protein
MISVAQLKRESEIAERTKLPRAHEARWSGRCACGIAWAAGELVFFPGIGKGPARCFECGITAVTA